MYTCTSLYNSLNSAKTTHCQALLLTSLCTAAPLCRGCGSKTAHELPVGTVPVPCCPRCKKTMSCFAPGDMDRVLKGLVQVHISWHKAGF